MTSQFFNETRIYEFQRFFIAHDYSSIYLRGVNGVKDKFRTFFKIFFPLLFCFYAANVILTTHIHIMDGVTIVHAHTDNEAGHTHTLAQFELLHTLGSIVGIDFNPATHLHELFLIFLGLICGPAIRPGHQRPYHDAYSLRAPPCL